MQMHQLDARIRRLLGELEKLTVRRSVPLSGIEIAAREGGVRRPFENGACWSEDGEWFDFFFSCTVPADFEGKVILRARTGRENEWEATNPQFIVRMGGQIIQALDTKHTTLLLQEKAGPGETYAITLNAYSQKTEHGRALPVLELSLQDINAQLEQLWYDITVPYQAAILLSEGDRERETTLETLARALDLLDLRAPHSKAFDASVKAARDYLKKEYYDKRRHLPAIATAEVVGHTHIDVAWLWDLYQTRYKAVRSFSTVLRLMELYPEYRFMSSQAALYNMIKEDEPALFARIQQAVKEGRWEVEGGMWVEADCNLASGESLIRQFLYGQKFFIREFGKRSRILWLPDVFGYSAALPQIMKLCGIDYFMTTKLSWSEFNMTPYDTFEWKGIDGTEVLTHFSPARDYYEEDKTGHDGLPYFTTYNAMINPRQIAGGWQRYQQKAIDDHFLVSYGYGDGGGGPTDWMLENQRRLETPMPGVPVTKQGHALPFFEGLEKRVKDDPRLPTWSGELYLEYHRGTYTAMARNKRSNRKMELLLREVELWRSLAERETGLAYPQEALDAIWQDVLTLQFHDILPGSSIQKVYDDSKIAYEAREQQARALLEEALAALKKGRPGDVLAFNSLSDYVRGDILWFDAPAGTTALVDADGRYYPVQFVEGRACAFVRAAAMTATPLWFHQGDIPVDEQPPLGTLKASRHGFETPWFEGKFDKAMRITSLVEKVSGREIVKAGEALNRIVCYENKPHNYDAWDINIYYKRRHWEVDDVTSVEVVAEGPVLCKLRVSYRYMDSTLTQDIVLYHDIGRVDFDTVCDWKEKQYLLKAHFPVDVFYNEATYDIQYGNLRRPTHTNTSWDIARFEVCAHKWADVSEAGFGVSLLNDCKYGHSIDEDSMALTLLKSSTHPSPIADQEEHRFTYALFPHWGGWREGGTVTQAYQLNVPLRAVQAEGAPKPEALTSEAVQETTVAQVAYPGSVVIESVKRAEDGDGLIIRLYECFGGRVKTTLTLGFAPKSVETCNALEEKIAAVAVNGREVALDLKPYEILTFRVR